MRRLALLLAVTAACTLAAAAAGAGKEAPRLRIASEPRLFVTGASFRPHELVKIVAAGTFGTRSGRVRATAGGSFGLRFARLTGDPCVLRRLSAFGSRGSRAVLRLPPGSCVHLRPPRTAELRYAVGGFAIAR